MQGLATSSLLQESRAGYKRIMIFSLYLDKSLKTKPTLKRIKDGKKIAMKKKINIGSPILDQIYAFYLKCPTCLSGEHVFDFLKERLIGFFGLWFKIVILAHLFKELLLFFI